MTGFNRRSQILHRITCIVCLGFAAEIGASFGEITSAANTPRQVQFAAKFSF